MTETEINKSAPASGSLLPRLIKNALKLILVVILLYFISKQVAHHWNAIIDYDWTINPWLLALSVVSHAVTFVLFSKVWCFIISGFGYRVKVRHGFKLAYISNLGRYLPGKFWTIFGMAYLARRLGIKEE